MPWLSCAACGGSAGKVESCTVCRGRGQFTLTACPRNQVDAGSIEAIEMYRLARDGHWPVGGGVLDQTDAFLGAYQILRRLLPEV